MKRIFLTLLLTVALTAMAGAQNLKFGHINSQELISLMTEMDSARMNLQLYQQDLEETMHGMEDEYNTKYTEYQRKNATWTPAVREAKEKDLQDLVQRIQQFQQTAQQDMQRQQQLLMGPIFQKANDAIQKVAKEQALIYVFDTSVGSVIYFDEALSVDLLPLAKKELGIPAEKVAPTQLPNPADKK